MKVYYKLLDDSKRPYYSSKINQHNTTNSKIFFRLTKKLMGVNGDITLPSHTNEEKLLTFIYRITSVQLRHFQADPSNGGFYVTPPVDSYFRGISLKEFNTVVCW